MVLGYTSNIDEFLQSIFEWYIAEIYVTVA